MQLRIATDEERRRQTLDESYDELSKLVTENGPLILNRGMKELEANQAILACLDKLLTKRVPIELMEKLEAAEREEQQRRRALEKRIAAADKVFELLQTYDGGLSFLARERLRHFLEEYYA